MQQPTVIVTENVTTLKPKLTASPEPNHQGTQKLTANLFLDTDLDTGTLAIVNQIEAEKEYYQTCGKW
ncbi:hypothetical protein A0J48_013235 [Sphaerospermopsis aphanizomenoides BCCUSP55]|uniref:hypothetical protein n=1 Tax=Sphaerospermopsis aphanizomenoides TaxID=459663 RepID=UPI0019057B55|nr:hypothetical protein [Sphaerospermopsis aphanizomenoides]MBK1988492.1 hypothetical protein [Sphaerospermopsis aphanizomenoides BCCUSP55]